MKTLYVVRGVGHFAWGGPTAPTAEAGGYLLAWQKTFLDGDTRWRSLLPGRPSNAQEFSTTVR